MIEYPFLIGFLTGVAASMIGIVIYLVLDDYGARR